MADDIATGARAMVALLLLFNALVLGALLRGARRAAHRARGRAR
ncbi:hypothetical protein ACFW61_24590 [Streptomyces microflavus]